MPPLENEVQSQELASWPIIQKHRLRKLREMTPLSAKGLQGLIPLLAGLGTVVQVLVLLALALASVVCWAIIVQKMRVLWKVRRDNTNFLHVFRTSNDLAFIAAAARRFTFSPLAHLFRVAHQHIEVPMSGNGRRTGLDNELVALSGVTLERLRQALRPRQAEELDRLEHGLPFHWTGEWGLFGSGRARYCGCVDCDSCRTGSGYSCGGGLQSLSQSSAPYGWGDGEFCRGVGAAVRDVCLARGAGAARQWR